jgi:HEAT repeat protein
VALQKLTVETWLRPVTAVARLVPLLLPALILAGAMQRPWHDPRLHSYFAVGAGLLLIVAVIVYVYSATWRHPASPAVIMLHLTALGWLIFGTRDVLDWYVALSQALLLIFPLLVLAFHTLRGSGVIEVRRAQLLAEVIERRPVLPMDLDQSRDLPEIKAFREALNNDPTPAMALLGRGSAPVQVAALCALEAHRKLKQWHVDWILRLIRKSTEPSIKAAAVLALANVPKREIVEKLAELLRDRAKEVRQAAARALLARIEERWPWIRTAVQHALADADLSSDGPLWPTAQSLPRDILSEIHGWTAAGGTLGARAAITLAAHYRRALVEDSDPALLTELRRLVLNRQVPMTLRHELAQLLDQEGELTAQDLEFMLHSGDAAPLRLFAADALLARGEHLEAVQTLRELARVPNREMAVSTAAVVQRRMGVDLGLDLEATLPALHTRQAAEITRRVMRWAVDGTPNPVNESAAYPV